MTCSQRELTKTVHGSSLHYTTWALEKGQLIFPTPKISFPIQGKEIECVNICMYVFWYMCTHMRLKESKREGKGKIGDKKEEDGRQVNPSTFPSFFFIPFLFASFSSLKFLLFPPRTLRKSRPNMNLHLVFIYGLQQ